MGNPEQPKPDIDFDRRAAFVILLAAVIFTVGLFHATEYRRSYDAQRAQEREEDLSPLSSVSEP